jgi:hypothetical protein
MSRSYASSPSAPPYVCCGTGLHLDVILLYIILRQKRHRLPGGPRLPTLGNSAFD